jgi:hypothetical protein
LVNQGGQETQLKIMGTTTNAKLFQRKAKAQSPAAKIGNSTRTDPALSNHLHRKKQQQQNEQVSHLTSDEKWQTQAGRFITNWTPCQMDAYLVAILDMAIEWIVEPG